MLLVSVPIHRGLMLKCALLREILTVSKESSAHPSCLLSALVITSLESFIALHNSNLTYNSN